MYDKLRIFGICFLGLYLSSCSPEYRLQRLLKNNPYLYEIYTHDSIRIQTFNTTDSVFFFQKQTDTIRFENATIYRHFDTLRLRQSCPPCTTYITKTIMQPTEKYFKEKKFKRSLREKLEDSILPILVGFLLALLIKKI